MINYNVIFNLILTNLFILIKLYKYDYTAVKHILKSEVENQLLL